MTKAAKDPPTLVALLREFDNNIAAIEAICKVVCYAIDDSFLQELVAMGGCALILDALQRHGPTEFGVAAAACGAVCNLCLPGRPPELRAAVGESGICVPADVKVVQVSV